MLHQAEFGLSREQRVVDMRGEIERNRLETRLRSARREKEAKANTLFEELSPRRGLVARSATFTIALFR